MQDSKDLFKQQIEQLKNKTVEIEPLDNIWQEEPKEIDNRNTFVSNLLGMRYAEVSFDNYEIYNDKQNAAVKVCKEYAVMKKSKGESLLLHGTSGTGKNHLIGSICREMKNTNVIVARFEILSEEKRAIQNSGSSWHKSMADYCKCQMLILPDMICKKSSGGNLELTESQKELLLYIIDYRYNNYLPLIIATNLTPGAIAKGFDIDGSTRIADRFSEIFKNRIVCLDWESYRKNK